MYYAPLAKNNSDGGVEEKKEDEPVTLSPAHAPHTNGLHHRYTSHYPNVVLDDAVEPINNRNEKSDDSFQAQIHHFVKSIIDSCESVVTFLVRGGESGCPWPGSTNTARTEVPRNRPTAVVKPPLSITDELRKLAESEGRVFGGGMRRADIPRFLGEEAVYSFDDDNISAISQHTLEEMTKHGIRHPIRRKLSSESSQSTSSLQPPPPPLPPIDVEVPHIQDEREGLV